MFNPFKKKDTGFNLDENPLPSLSDSSNFDSQNSPSLDSINSNTNSQIDNSFDMSSSSTQVVNESTNPFMQTPTTSNNSFNSNSNQDLHNDLIKTKIDSLEAKTNLIEAKISSMDQKLELIYKLLLEEVSEDTKRKFKVDSMMKNIVN